MKQSHSEQIVTFLSAQRPAYGSMSLEPAETRPESRIAFPRYDQLGDQLSYKILMPGTDYLIWRNRS